MLKSFCSLALVHTPCYELEDDRLEPPLGLLYIATWLRSYGYDTQIIDLSSIPSDRWAGLLPDADIYGFSTYTSTYHRTLKILQLVKEMHPDAYTVAGGPHASALPQTVARDFDWVVTGEGEMAMLHLMQALERGERLPEIISVPPVADLDVLPFPDYTLVDVASYHRVVDGQPSLSILSSRGCPYQCVFCNSIVMGGHRQMRFRSAGNVVEEIRQLKARWHINSFRFQDDLFTFNLQRLQEMMVLLEREAVTFRCFGRVNLCTQQIARLLRTGGCQHIAFGVESGSPDILRRMQKGQTVDDIRQGIANAKQVGMLVRVYLIVGFPGETWNTVKETVNLMLECQPDEFVVYPLIPYPGTPLFSQPARFGIQKINMNFSEYFQVQQNRGTGFVFQTEYLDENLIADMRDYVIEALEPAMTWAGDSKGFK